VQCQGNAKRLFFFPVIHPKHIRSSLDECPTLTNALYGLKGRSKLVPEHYE
jgi:hypothetical protein